jgi:hypothetical protein
MKTLIGIILLTSSISSFAGGGGGNGGDAILSDVDDSFELSIPAGCKKEQLVTQKAPVFPEDKRYTIAEAIWKNMDLDQRALTVLHESWYRTFIDESATDSRFARYMNGIFASHENLNINFAQYLEKLELAKKIGGFSNLAGQFMFRVQGLRGDVTYVMDLQIGHYDDNHNLHLSGSLLINPTVKASWDQSLIFIRIASKDFYTSDLKAIIDPSGKVLSLKTTAPERIKTIGLIFNNLKMSIKGNFEIKLNPSGRAIGIENASTYAILDGKKLISRKKFKEFKTNVDFVKDQAQYTIIK